MEPIGSVKDSSARDVKGPVIGDSVDGGMPASCWSMSDRDRAAAEAVAAC